MKDRLEFPKAILPQVVEDYFHDQNEKLGLVPEYMRLTCLATIGTLIGNKHVIEVNGGWQERPNLWFAIVGNAGVKKTPSVKAAIRPLEELDQELDRVYRSDMLDYNRKTKKEKESSDKPIPKQFIVDDITIEALAVVLLRNPNGVLLKKDELISWISDSTRYSSGGGAEQRWMSLYSGEPFRLNRKQDDEVTYVKDGFVNVVGGIQPAILPQLFMSNREYNGFINRIMFCYPPSLKSTVPVGEIDKELYGEYKVYIKKFLELPKTDSKTPRVLRLNEKANEFFKEWQEEFIYPSRNSDKLPDVIIGAVAKLEAAALRFALIFEFAYRISEGNMPVEISEYSIGKGIEMANYFYSNFESIYYEIKGDVISDKEKILTDYVRIVNQKIDRSDIVRQLDKLGYTNAQINKYLGYSKGSIHNWLKGKKK